MIPRRGASAALLLAGLLAGCSNATTPTAGAPTEPATRVTVLTHDGFAVSTDVLEGFETESGIRIDLEPAGDRHELVEKAVLAAEAGRVDVVYGVDSTLLDIAAGAGLFADHGLPAGTTLAAELPRPEQGAIPVGFGDVCVHVDRAWFARRGLAPPDGFADLAAPRHAGLLVIPDPTASAPGLGFLLASRAWFGELADTGFGWQGFWEVLLANGTLVAPSDERAYRAAFSASGGDRPLAVGTTADLASDALFGTGRSVTAIAETCLRHVEYTGVVRGSDAGTAAHRVVDFFLSAAFQADLPSSMFLYPASADVGAPPELLAVAPLVPEPLRVEPDEIGGQRNRMLRAWQVIADRYGAGAAA